MATNSVLIFINTGTSANSGTGDSLRTAFNKINTNFVRLENSFVAGGVASFNSGTGIVTFTGTDIISQLGYVPYDSANPQNFVTSAVISGFATKQYVDNTFVTTASFNLTSLDVATKSYVANAVYGLASESWVLSKDYVSTTWVINAFDSTLGQFVTKTYLTQQNYLDATALTNALTTYAQNLTDQLPKNPDVYSLGNGTFRWKNLFLSDTIWLQGVPITINTITNSISVNGVGGTGNFKFDNTSIYNNNTSFNIFATNNGDAKLFIPNNYDASNTRPLMVYNTGTEGILLQGFNTQVAIDGAGNTGLKVIGKLSLPVYMQGYAPNKASTTTDILTILPGLATVTNPDNTVTPASPTSIESYNKQGTGYSDLKIKGSTIQLMPVNNTSGQTVPSNPYSDTSSYRISIQPNTSLEKLRITATQQFFDTWQARPLEIGGGTSVEIANYYYDQDHPGQDSTIARWKFRTTGNLSDGFTPGLVFPDNTVQTTAFTGGGFPLIITQPTAPAQHNQYALQIVGYGNSTDKILFTVSDLGGRNAITSSKNNDSDYSPLAIIGSSIELRTLNGTSSVTVDNSGSLTITSGNLIFPDGSTQNTAFTATNWVSLAGIKALVAASGSWGAFQAAVAAL
jgi:hypothetical protein